MPQIWQNPWYGRGGGRLVRAGVPELVGMGGRVEKVGDGRQLVLPGKCEWLGRQYVLVLGGRQLVVVVLFLFVGLAVIGIFTSDLVLVEREASKDRSFSWSSSNDIEVLRA